MIKTSETIAYVVSQLVGAMVLGIQWAHVLVVVGLATVLARGAMPSSFVEPPAESVYLEPPPNQPTAPPGAVFEPGTGPVPLAFACVWNASRASPNIVETSIRATFTHFGLALPLGIIRVQSMPDVLPADTMAAGPLERTNQIIAQSNGGLVRVRWFIDVTEDHQDDEDVPAWRDDAMRFVAYYPAAFSTQTPNCRNLAEMTNFYLALATTRHVPTYGEGFFLLVGTAAAALLLALLVFICRYTEVLTILRQRTKVFDDTADPATNGDGMEEILRELDEPIEGRSRAGTGVSARRGPDEALRGAIVL
jgi:hypothetical protein